MSKERCPVHDRIVKATQEDLLIWVHSDRKGLCWETQYKFRTPLLNLGTVQYLRDAPRFAAAQVSGPHRIMVIHAGRRSAAARQAFT